MATTTCKISVLNKKGSQVETLELNPQIFASRVNARLLELVNIAYAGNKRQGNASTKGRKEVRGGGRKPWRQKGTGRARAGSIRSPIWRGGGITFGPKPRSYTTNLSNTMKREALRSALGLRFQANKILVLDDFSLKSAKTKEFAGILKALKVTERILCIAKSPSQNLKLASRNLKKASLADSREVTAYDILRNKKCLISKEAISLIEKRLSGQAKKEKGAQAALKEKKKELAEVK